MQKIRTEPGVESMRLETPVIDVSSDERLSGDTLNITASDEGELEEAIAAIERLERSMRFPD